jgi:hypothetical protein
MVEIEFETDDLSLKQIEQWLGNQSLVSDTGLFIPLLTSASDHRRCVRLTGGTVKARKPMAIYILHFDSDQDGLLFAATFQMPLRNNPRPIRFIAIRR